MQRQVRQQRADIDSLYELVTELQLEVRESFAETRESFAELREGLAAVNSKLDAQFGEILRRLPGN